MTDTLALDFLANVAVVAGVIILLAFKDLEQSDVDDPLRSWRLNGILAFICAVYVWNGDSTPAYPPESSLGTLIVWGMTVVWIGHATYHLGLFRLATDQTNAPQLLPNSLGIATSALIALLEELLFRGWLQNELYRVDHALSADVYSIFAINLLFGLMHYNRGFMFALSAGFVGMIFSIATLASGSLLPAIVMHVGWNVLVGLARRLRPHEVVESAD